MATPNVFFDAGSLSAYLGQFLSAEQADELAGVVASIPVGTVKSRLHSAILRLCEAWKNAHPDHE